jgi:RNA polymerase sigma-70 factor (ECF subfamily)
MPPPDTADQSTPESFEREALPHLDTCFRVACRLTGDPSRAEDLVQETMLKAFRAWHRFRPGTNARGWLLTILRNSFINQYRKQKREPLGVDIDAVDPMAIYHRVGQTDPEGEFFGKLIDRRVLAAIDGLAIEFREVLVLSDIEDLGYAEISSMLEIPIGTVKSRLFRARRHLQEQLYDHAVEMGYITPRERQLQ